MPADGETAVDGRERVGSGGAAQGVPAEPGGDDRGGAPPPGEAIAAVEPAPGDAALIAELQEARSQLARLRAEAERLEADYETLRGDVSERAEREGALRVELEETRSRLERLGAEVGALRERAGDAERLEAELRTTSQEAARLRGECQEARAAAAAADRELEALLAHSADVQNGLYQALAEIEAGSDERLINPKEAERLRARIGELEGRAADAVAARKTAEEGFARAIRSREDEVKALREKLGAIESEITLLRESESEAEQIRATLAGSGPGGVAVHAETGSTSPGPPPVEVEAVLPPFEMSRAASERSRALPAPSRYSAEWGRAEAWPRRGPLVVLRPGVDPMLHHDIALESSDVREPPADLVDLLEAPTYAAEPAAVGPSAAPPNEPDRREAEAHRLQAEVIRLKALGRLPEAEAQASRVAEICREITGECHPHYAISLGALGSLRAQQGNWAGAKSAFDQRNDVCRELFGESDPRYLAGLGDSAEMLLAGGDPAGGKGFFEEAEALCRRALGDAHPLAKAFRQRLDRLRTGEPGFGTHQIIV
jgi:predicted  nucleic acid-binding Zn-ribbon protein